MPNLRLATNLAQKAGAKFSASERSRNDGYEIEDCTSTNCKLKTVAHRRLGNEVPEEHKP